MKWTDDIKTQLRTLWLDGKTSGQIAEILNVTRNSVMGQVNRLGLLGKGQNKPAHIQSQKSKLFCEGIEPASQVGTPEIFVEEIIQPGQYTIPTLTQRTCHWPMGPTMEPSTFFCGEPVEYAGRPYCPAHAQLAYSGWQPRYIVAEKTQNGKLGAEEFAKRRLAFQRRGRSAPVVPSLVPGQAARTG